MPHPDYLAVPPGVEGQAVDDYVIHFPPKGKGFQFVAIGDIVSAHVGIEEEG